MDYKNFLSDYNTYNEWNRVVKREAEEEKQLCQQDLDFESSVYSNPVFSSHEYLEPFAHLARVPIMGEPSSDTITFGDTDRVNHPSHYTRGKQEVIDIIEDAIKDAPTVSMGLLQGQALKYLLRIWLKDNSLEDAQKARWYLNRLIKYLEVTDDEPIFKPFS